MLVAGFVLVGGRSTRMGRDKARLPVESHLLVEDVAAKVSCIAQSVALVGDSRLYRDLGIECLDDIRPGCGPLAGIHTALQTKRGDLSLIVACDMPDLRAAWLEQLVIRASQEESDCVVCRDLSGAIHPLCSVWRRNCLPRLERALDEGRLRVLDFIEELDSAYVTISETIANVNTPEEWLAWQTRDRDHRETAPFS